MKTPPLDDVLRPLRAMEAEAARQYADAVERATIKAMVGKIAAEESAKAARKAYKSGGVAAAMDALQADEAPNEAPIRRRFIVNDATIEVLGVVLKTNPYGALLFRDELAGFLRQMDRQGHEGDRHSL